MSAYKHQFQERSSYVSAQSNNADSQKNMSNTSPNPHCMLLGNSLALTSTAWKTGVVQVRCHLPAIYPVQQ